MYLRAPMGSSATIPYFDKAIAGMLECEKLFNNGVVMIHDDNAGYSATIYDDNPEGKSHFHLLRRYLKACAQRNVTLSPKKFEVFCTSLDIAGHLHKNGGLRPSPPRYQAIVDAPPPKTVWATSTTRHARLPGADRSSPTSPSWKGRSGHT